MLTKVSASATEMRWKQICEIWLPYLFDLSTVLESTEAIRMDASNSSDGLDQNPDQLCKTTGVSLEVETTAENTVKLKDW